MITFSNVPTTARASALFVEQEAVDRGTGSAEIPHKIFVLGQVNTGYAPVFHVPRLMTDYQGGWDLYGRSSMLSRLLQRIMKNCGSVSVYAVPLSDDAAASAATWSIVISGTAKASGTLHLYIEGEEVKSSVVKGASLADIATALTDAVNADLDLPVTAESSEATVTLTCRWKGESGKQIHVVLNLDEEDVTPEGLGVQVNEPTGGESDPDLTKALENMKGTWFTEVVCPYTSKDALSALVSAGEERNDPGVKRQFLAFIGYTDSYENYLKELDSWNSEWLSFVPVHGSPSSAYMIAASAAAIWAKYQQNNPGRPVKTLKLPGVIAASGNNLTWSQINAAIWAGGSYTVNRSDGTVQLGDICTTRTKTDAGAVTEDYQFAIIVPNLQFKIYALEQKYLASPYDRGVVVVDGPGRKPTYAVSPNMVKTSAIGLVDDWVTRGLSTNRDEIVENIASEINSSNPGRIDLLIPDIATAGLRIVGIKLEWGFVS